MGAGVAAAGGLGAAAGLAGRSWWERVPGEEVPISAIQPPTPFSIEANFYNSSAREGTLTCQSCHSSVDESLPVSYCHVPHSGGYVRCNLCPHLCIIADGQRGTCRVRENRAGRLYSVVYGNPCALHVDPIEKKPFFHYLPSASAFSLATAGCNLRCLYCQNWTISQVSPEMTENIDLPPEGVVQAALQYQAPVIAFTYSEPTVFFEYMLATAQLARQSGLRSVVITAGFIETEPLLRLCQHVDAIKVDLKGYDEAFYREVCGADLGPVLRAIETIFHSGVHLEIVNLVVPTLNDSLQQLRTLAAWVAQTLSPDIPLHFSRFHPQYKLLNLPSTPVETLDQAYEIAAEEGMHFVYVGNVPGHRGSNTYCPSCAKPIILREGFAVDEYHVSGGLCEFCAAPIPGVWWPVQPEDQPIQIPPGGHDT